MRQKIIILFYNDPTSQDEFKGGTTAITYNSATLTISGNYLMVSEANDDNTEITTQVFTLDTVSSYKTYQV